MSAPALPPLVDARWLRDHRDEVAVVDVRWYPDDRPRRTAFEAAHIPGAAYVDLDAFLADPPSRAAGRHPLPAPTRFAAGMAAAGIGDETPVVAYDDAGGAVAARLVWLLRALEHPAALLDGGLAAWPGPIAHGPPQVALLSSAGDANARPPASFTPRPWPPELLATVAEVAALPAGTILVDARAPERYRGDTEPLDARAGHIPGAVNLPFAGNLDARGRFLPVAALQERFAAAGITAGTPVVAYCGSGVTACHDLLALEAAGLGRGRLYPGSWSQYSADPARPIATGAPAAEE